MIDKPQKAIMADTLEDIAKVRDTNITSIASTWARLKQPWVFPASEAGKSNT